MDLRRGQILQGFVHENECGPDKGIDAVMKTLALFGGASATRILWATATARGTSIRPNWPTRLYFDAQNATGTLAASLAKRTLPLLFSPLWSAALERAHQ
jgi:hypothetical protein